MYEKNKTGASEFFDKTNMTLEAEMRKNCLNEIGG